MTTATDITISVSRYARPEARVQVFYVRGEGENKIRHPYAVLTAGQEITAYIYGWYRIELVEDDLTPQAPA